MIQDYIDKLEELREWLHAWIDIKVWADNPLKPTPWKSFRKIFEPKSNDKEKPKIDEPLTQ